MGSGADSSYKSIGIKCIKCYFSCKICLWCNSDGDGGDDDDNNVSLYKEEWSSSSKLMTSYCITNGHLLICDCLI